MGLTYLPGVEVCLQPVPPLPPRVVLSVCVSNPTKRVQAPESPWSPLEHVFPGIFRAIQHCDIIRRLTLAMMELLRLQRGDSLAKLIP